MKKIACVLLMGCFLFCFVACAAPHKPASTEPVSTQISTEPPPVVPTEEFNEVPEETNLSETESIEETTSTMVFSYTVYIPNDNADGFVEEIVEVHEVSPDSVLTELKNRNVLPDDVEVNYCSIDDGFVTIDFNQSFADAVCSTGTSGELMLVGSVVNTYLSAFGADSIYFTVDGNMLESGHTIYDFVMSYFSMSN